MPVRSLNSSVLKWPDQKAVDRAIRRWAEKAVEKHGGILKIGYIGSYARGDWGVGSDLDLIIVIQESHVPFWRRSLELDYPESPVPVDVLVYTLEEWEKIAAQDNLFYKTVSREAIWIYRRM